MKKRRPLSVILSAFLVVCCCLAILPNLPDRSNSNSTTEDTGFQVERTRVRPSTTTPRPPSTRQPEVTIKVNQANIRSGPGTNYPIVDTVTGETKLRVIATDQAGDWYNVTWSNGERGWVWHENIETGSLSNIRAAATIPALPTGAALKPPTSQPAAPTNPPTERPPVCDCSGDNYNCDSFYSQGAAQACFNYCMPLSGDIHRLDRDNDGRVCE